MHALRSVLLTAVFVAAGLAGCMAEPQETSEQAEARRVQAGGAQGPAVYPGSYSFDGRYSQVLAEGPYTALPPQRVFLTSELDGVDIEIGFHLPDVPEGTKVPVIVDASPYHRGSTNVMMLAGMRLFLHDNFLPHGYAVAAISVRGSGNSGGCFDLMGQKEVADLDQAITWLGTQPWSNGNVGMIGVSYDGSTPWDVASTGNPHLATIVPISGLPDIFGLMYRNGSSEERGAFLVNALYYTYGPSPDDAASQNEETQRTPENRAEGTACPDYGVGFASAGWATVIGDRDPAEYWAERNRKPAIEENYRGSILLVQGLQDWNVDPALVIPWVNTLNASGVPLKQMLGQWGHMSPDNRASDGSPQKWTRYDWAEILLHWWDKWLKGLDVDTGPNAQVQDQTGRWHNEDAFPPLDTQWTTYHLSSGNALTLEPGAAGSVQLVPQPQGELGCEQFRSMPASACTMAEFGLAAPEGGLHFSGLPRLHVTVTPQGAGGNLAAFLYDLAPDGTGTQIGWTTMNLQYADGTETRSTVTPGQDLVAKMEFQPLDDYIAPGHRLVVRLWEYQDHGRIPSVPPSPMTLKFGGSTTSILDLPIIERAPEEFFLPPMPPTGYKPEV